MRYVIGMAAKPGASEKDKAYYRGILIYTKNMLEGILDSDTIDLEIKNGAIVPMFDTLAQGNAAVQYLSYRSRKYHLPCCFFLQKYDTKEIIFKVTKFNRNLRLSSGVSMPCYEFIKKERFC